MRTWAKRPGIRHLATGLSLASLAACVCTSALAQSISSVAVNPDVAIYTLSLEDSVRLALTNNLNLQSSFDVVQGTQISEQVAKSRFNFKVTPTFSRGFGQQSFVDQRYGVEVSRLLPFGATLATNVRSDLSNSDFGNLTNSSLALSLVQPLLRGFGTGVTRFDLTNARRSMQGAERNLDLAKQRLAVDVVASYFNIVRQQGLLQVAERSMQRSNELLRASEARLEVGLASKLDVFRAELQLSQAEESTILRREALELAMDSFKFRLGLAPGDQVAVEIVEPDYFPIAVDLDMATAQALSLRVEMAEERDRIEDGRRALAVNRHNLLPQLDLNVRYEQRGLGATFSESFNFQDRGWNVFLSSSYQLDRTQENASYALTKIDVDGRRRAMRLREYNIANEVRAAARNVERVGKSIELQERNIDFADRQLRLANLRYQRGLASNFDIIDAENNLIQARSNYVSLLADHVVASMDLKRVTGTLDLESEFLPGTFLPPGRHHP